MVVVAGNRYGNLVASCPGGCGCDKLHFVYRLANETRMMSNLFVLYVFTDRWHRSYFQLSGKIIRGKEEFGGNEESYSSYTLGFIRSFHFLPRELG